METLLSATQAAAQLGICSEGVRRLIRIGQLEASRVGGVFRIRPTALDKLLEDRKVNKSNRS